MEKKWLYGLAASLQVTPIDAEQGSFSVHAANTAVVHGNMWKEKTQRDKFYNREVTQKEKAYESHLTHYFKTPDCAQKQTLIYTNNGDKKPNMSNLCSNVRGHYESLCLAFSRVPAQYDRIMPVSETLAAGIATHFMEHLKSQEGIQE